MKVFKRIIRIFCYIIIFAGLTGLVLCCFHSDVLLVTKYTYDSGLNITPFKAVVVADFHHRDIYFPNGNLIDKINEEKPDVIFFPGDIIDEYVTSIDPVLKILDGTNKVPIYYVTGNYDVKSPFYEQYLEELNKREWCHFFDKQFVALNDKINLFGLEDPRMDSKKYDPFSKDYGKLKEQLDIWQTEGRFSKDKVNILISHRPEIMDLYVKYDVNMIISGHSHGGQIRIGNFSPFRFSHGFSIYDKGEFIENNKHLYVSAGLGYSAMIPIRVNCNPEILSITIK